MIQLSLFPARRFGILTFAGLAWSVYAQAPALFKTRRAAGKAARWLHGSVVDVDVHEGDVPTLVVHS